MVSPDIRPLFCIGMMARDLIYLVRMGRRAYRERLQRTDIDSQTLVFKHESKQSRLMSFFHQLLPPGTITVNKSSRFEWLNSFQSIHSERQSVVVGQDLARLLLQDCGWSLWGAIVGRVMASTYDH